jgi:hypothetical protein
MSALPETFAPPRDVPFKFLNFFTEADAAGFAGRDAEIRTVLSGFTAGRTYVVYGPSGVGKSSLLHAGVIPRLKARGYRPIYFRVLNSPIPDLLDAVNKTLGVEAAPESLPELLASTSDDVPIVLILDQFEEFFIRFDEEKKPLQREFAALLSRIVTETSSVHLIFSLREDYYASLSDLKPHLPDLLTQGLRLLPLTAFGARQAILAPLAMQGIRYDGGVVGLLIDDLAQNDFDPVILQILCTEVYRAALARHPEDPCLTEQDFHQVGGSAGIFLRYVQGVKRGLGSEQALLVQSILDAMTTERGTKMALRVSDLAPEDPAAAAESSLYFKATRMQAVWVLRHLRDHSVVRAIDANDEWYELLHDRLVKVIKSSLEDDPEFNKFRNAKRFVSEFTKSLMATDPHRGNAPFRAKAGQLMSIQQLEDLVEPFEAILRLTPAETDFVLRSHILGQTPRIDHWFGELARFPGASPMSVLDRSLQAADARIRAGASFAAGQLPEVSPKTIALVLEVALTDSDANARRRAAETLARCGGPLNQERIRHALRSRAERGHAIDLLAELASLEKAIPGTGPIVELRVRRRLRARAFHDARDAINRGAQIGAISGACVGFGWTITFASLIWVLYRLLFLPDTVIERGAVGSAEFGALTGFGLLATILGTLIGWRTGVRFEKRRALASPADWMLLPLRGVLQTILITIAGWCAAATVMDFKKFPSTSSDAVGVFTAFLAVVAAAMVVRRGVLSETRQLAIARSMIRRIGAALFRLWPLAIWLAVAGVALEMESDTFSDALAVAMTVVAALLVNDAAARWASHCVGSRKRILQAVAWTAAVAAVPLVAILLSLARPAVGAWGEVLVAVALTTSYVSAIGGVTLGLLTQPEETSPTLRRISRATAGAGVAVVLLLAIYWFGPVASYAVVVPIAVGEEITERDRTITTRWPLVHYYAVMPEQRGPSVITTEMTADERIETNIGINRLARIAFPDAPARLAVYPRTNHPQNAPALPYGFRFRREPVLTAGVLRAEKPVYVNYRLTRQPNGEYTGRIVAKNLVPEDNKYWVVDVRIPAAGYGQRSSEWFCSDFTRDHQPGDIARGRWRVSAKPRDCEFPRMFSRPVVVALEGDLDVSVTVTADPRPGAPQTQSIELIAELTARRMTYRDLQEHFQSAFSYLDDNGEKAFPGDIDAALRLMELHADGLSDDAGARSDYALKLLEYRRVEEAMAAAEAAVAIDPKAASSWDVLAHAAYDAQRWSTVLEALAKAEQLGYMFDEQRCTLRDQWMRTSAQDKLAATASRP